jgi:ABC-type Zn uptake system ZnuABC Zn-binding protein ZnuA
MKNLLPWLAVLTLAAADAAWAASLKVVTTTSDLGAIAKAVAGDRAEVRSICTGKEDPHMLQAKPSCILLARDADLWIRIGLELEIGWEPPILDGSRNARIREGASGHLDAAEAALILDIPTEKVTRALGDVHPQGNPHYWLDPLNGRRIAGAIGARLAQIAPADASHFRANASAFQHALDERMFGAELLKATSAEQLWAMTEDGTIAALLADSAQRGRAGGWLAAMQPLRGQSIVTYHRSWIYFAHRFGLSIAGEIEPKPGVPPSAGHLRQLAQAVRGQGVQIILQEPFYNRRAADRLAGETGASVVVVANSVGGQPEATDYLALMDLIVKRLTER